MVIGAVAERGRIWPTIVFVFVWTTLVYNFLAHWIWSINGWATLLGAVDFAGGVPIHLAAGTGALVYSYFLGPRQPTLHPQQSRPHNLNNIFIGTALSWFGWFGFNAGSGLTISGRAGLVCIVTNLAACTGGFTWCMWDYFLNKPKYKFSLFGFCMGAMAGLVCITPASGFICIPGSLAFGIAGVSCVYFGRKIKVLLKIDDPFDIFAQHGIGGFVGTILTGIFAQKSIPAIDKVVIHGGWIDRHWMQIVYQLAYAGWIEEKQTMKMRHASCLILAAGAGWTVVMTFLILIVLNRIPGLSLRVNEEQELQGIDHDQFNEYTHDYVEIQRDLYEAIPKCPVMSNPLVTVTTIDHQNNVHKQNDIKMVKIKPVSVASNGW